ncbi:hypothetical protein ACFSRY_14855 [Pontibacter locisalis]|uniref:Outer membrane protein beta-barrel domain-containing protein n=1 Tax=Pontibacter locisalis TaxID=1719035 RepID=A0ABW5IT34_9BACT
MRKLPLIFLLFFLDHFSKAQSQNEYVQDVHPDSDKGYMGMIEIGYLYGKMPGSDLDRSRAAASFQIFNGYRFNRFLAVGGTVGFDSYDDVLITPLALGIRGELTDTRISPIYSLEAGYGSAKLTDTNDQFDARGGWMFNPALGIRAMSGNKTAFTFTVGYKNQRVETLTYLWNSRTEQKINFKRLTIRMGFTF